MSAEEIIAKPSKYFKSPDALVSSDILNNEQKRDALENWKQSSVHVMDGDYEGLLGTSENKLADINDALEKLKGYS